MARRLALLGLLLVTSAAASAAARDTAVPVSGVVIDAKGAAVPSATVVMLRHARTVVNYSDGELLQTVARAVTDTRGRFSFGPIDSAAYPLPRDVMSVRDSKLEFDIVTSDGHERAVDHLEAAADRGKDDAIEALHVTITVR